MSEAVARKKYTIGQVLYLIPVNKNVIIPLLIIEEIYKKTLQGEETNFLVRFSKNEADTATLAEMQGEIFDTLKDVQKELTTRAQKSIEKLTANATNAAQDWYKLDAKAVPEETTVQQIQHNALTNESNDNTVLVTLPDGTKARLRQ